MKVFSKLKGIFFDEVEDEDETPELEEKIQIKEVAHEEKKEEFKPFDLDEVKEEKEEKLENPVNDFSERELFRSEKPFTFTEFNEPEDELPPRRSVLDLDREEVTPVKKTYEEESYTPRRNITIDLNDNKPSDTQKVFKPSPIISPIYGILDKDYKKEEIKEKEKKANETRVSTKVTTYDSVRKKAYGTLEDELEDTLNSMNGLNTKEINEEAEKEENLLDTDDFNDASKTIAEITEKTQKIEDLISKIQETTTEIDRSVTIGDLEDTLEMEEEPKEEVKEEKPVEEDKTMTDSTLEHDLFNLIDSMYDDKED